MLINKKSIFTTSFQFIDAHLKAVHAAVLQSINHVIGAKPYIYKYNNYYNVVSIIITIMLFSRYNVTKIQCSWFFPTIYNAYAHETILKIIMHYPVTSIAVTTADAGITPPLVPCT